LSYRLPRNHSAQEGTRRIDGVSFGVRIAAQNKTAGITVAHKTMEEETTSASRENYVPRLNLAYRIFLDLYGIAGPDRRQHAFTADLQPYTALVAQGICDKG
jgi:hypothetical protein